MTKKINMQVRIDADCGVIFFEKKLKTGLNIPVDTIPRMMVAKKGAINFPTSKIAIKNNAIKKIKTAFGEIFCFTVSPLFLICQRG